jgi:hypothetical protein
LCRTSVSNGSVENWYNNGFAPAVLDSAQPQLGLSNVRVFAANGMIHCFFTRENSVSNYRYYNIDNSSLPFVISAFGSGIE